jgi:hypothetical protein
VSDPDGTQVRLARLARAARRADEAARDAREARNAAIAEAEAAGWTVHRIAEATELGHSHVQRIVLAQLAGRQD